MVDSRSIMGFCEEDFEDECMIGEESTKRKMVGVLRR